MLLEDRLDLLQLDAHAADLHLVVGAAEELQGAVALPADQVAGAVEAFAGRAERVGDEVVGGAARVVDVAAAEVDPARVQLARHADRDGLEPVVQDVEPGVGVGPADGDGAADRPGAVDDVADADGGLGRSVAVVHHGLARGAEAGEQFRGEHLAAAPHVPQRGRAAGEAVQFEEQVEHRGDQVGEGHPVPFDGVEEVVDVPFAAGFGDHHAAAVDQRQEDLVDGDVEAERRLEQGRVVGAEAEQAALPQQPVRDGPVADHRALGDAGRAGGVDDVGEAFRVDVHRRPLGGGAVQGDLDDGRRVLPQEAVVTGPAEYGGQGRAAAHLGDAPGRPGRLQRDEGPARLQHGEQPDDHLRGPLQVDADAVLRAHPGGHEPPCEAVGAGVELAVGEGRAAGDAVLDGHQVRGLRGLFLHQGGERGGRHGARGVVPLPQQQVPLARREDVGGRHRAVGVPGQLAGQADEALGHLPRGVPVVQVAAVHQGAVDAAGVGPLEHVEGQVGLGGVEGDAPLGQGETGEVPAVGRGLLVGQHHLEQRVPAHRAGGRERVHQPFEGQVLVGEGVHVGLAHPGEQRAERRGARDVGAQHEGVDEQAHEVVQDGVAAPGHRGAQGDVVAGAEPAEEDGEGGLEGHEDGAACLGGQVPQRPVGLRIEGEVHGPGPVTGHGWAGPVDGQLEFLGQPVQTPRPVAHLLGGVLLVEEVPLPQGVVGVLHGERRPRGGCAAQSGGVGGLQVAQQRFGRPAVGGDVVDEQEQDVVVGGEGVQGGADGDLAVQGEGVGGGLAQQRVEVVGGRGDGLEGDGGVRADLLPGDAVVVGEDGAQCLVPVHDVLERRAQGLVVERSAEADGGGDVVGGGRPFQPVQEPQPGLREGQRHGVGAPGRDQRGPPLGGRLQQGCEGGRGGRVEDGPQRQGDAQFRADAGDEPGGEEGVAAEREERVVDAHGRQSEQVREEAAQGRLGLGAGRVGGGERGQVGVGQGGAVEFAVGGERQGVQHDDGGGHLVAGQGAGQVPPELLRLRAGAGVRDDVGDQPRIAVGVLTYRHRGLGHPGQGGRRGLRLARLDPEAADLHLVVGPAQELQRPVGGPAHDVAGAVEAGARRAVGVGDEASGGQGGPAEVAPGELAPAEVQLAWDARRHRAQGRVQHEGAGVPHRASDRHGARRGAGAVGARPRGHVHGRLGGAVEVVQCGAVQQAGAAFGEVRRQGLAAAHDPAQDAPGPLGGRVVEEDPQHRRDEVGGGDALFADQLGEVGGVAVPAGAGEDQRRSGDQRQEELPDGDVEARRGLLEHPVPGPDAVGVRHPQQPVDDRRVRDDDALGAARGAGGEDDVRGVLGAQRREAFPVGEGGGVQGRQALAQGGVVEQERRCRRGGDLVRGGTGGQDERRGGVLDHHGEPFGGVAGVQRDVGGARLEYREQRHDQVGSPVEGHGHALLRADAVTDQQAGQAGRAGVQSGVAEGEVLEGERRRVGGAGRLLGEQVGQGGAGDRVGGGVPLAQDLVFLGRGHQRQP